MGLAEELGIGCGITAVIGSGGKTSLLDALARELDGTVVLTTTTHVLPFGCPVLTDADERAVEQALWYSRVVCVGTPTGDGSGKLAAPRLKMRTLSVLADYVLVEADGAARHPLKAHASYEPVIPAGADRVVQVVGASGFGQPVAQAVHRPEVPSGRFAPDGCRLYRAGAGGTGGTS